MEEVWVALANGERVRVRVDKRSWRTRVKHWLWEIGMVELPFYEQPEVPLIRGEALRAVLAARGHGI